MLFVRVSAFFHGERVMEDIFGTDNQVKALESFRAENPNLDNCILVAQTIDSKDPKWTEYIEVCLFR